METWNVEYQNFEVLIRVEEEGLLNLESLASSAFDHVQAIALQFHIFWTHLIYKILYQSIARVCSLLQKYATSIHIDLRPGLFFLLYLRTLQSYGLGTHGSFFCTILDLHNLFSWLLSCFNPVEKSYRIILLRYYMPDVSVDIVVFA